MDTGPGEVVTPPGMSDRKATNVVWQSGKVSRSDREKLLDQRGATLWFTGLPSSGKSTLAVDVERRLHDMGYLAYLLDGDNIRHGLNSNLGFSPEERTENIRRIGEVSKLFSDVGILVLTAFISPYRADRDRARSIHPEGTFVEIHVDCPVEVCEQRDPKGLYRKARAGQVPDFTGVSAPYEAPLAPELVIRTGATPLEECVRVIVAYLAGRGFISASGNGIRPRVG